MTETSPSLYYTSGVILSQAEKAVLDYFKYSEAAIDVPTDGIRLHFLTDYNQGITDFDHCALQEHQIFMAITGMDFVARKDGLANAMSVMWGVNQPWTPKTCSLIDPYTFKINQQDYALLLDVLKQDGKSHVIAKKNLQRQEGLVIHSLEDVPTPEQLLKDGYIVLQEIVERPLLFHDRKINLRYYVLFLQRKGTLKIFTHQTAILNYAKKPVHQDMQFDKDNLITTAFLDPIDYKALPLDSRVLFETLSNGDNNRARQVIHHALQAACISLAPWVMHQSGPATYAQIFGADVQIDATLQRATVFEFNKQPDLNFWDERDLGLKVAVVRDFYNEIGIINMSQDTSANLVLLWQDGHGDIGSQIRRNVIMKGKEKKK